MLPPYPDDLSGKARTQLERLGVEVWTGARVTGIDASGVNLGDERIVARTVAVGRRRGGVAPARGPSACRSIAPAACWSSPTCTSPATTRSS